MSSGVLRVMGAAALSFGVLAGCAQKKPWVPYESVSPAHCTSKTQCDAMWARATSEIVNVSGMKIRLLTDSYIETFDGTRQFRMYGRVQKRPLGNDSYEIIATLTCGYACGDLALRGESLFNSSVRMAGGLAPTDGKATNSLNKAAQSYSNENGPQFAAEYARVALETYLECIRATAARASANSDFVQQSLNACVGDLKNYRAAAFKQAQMSQGGDIFVATQAAEDAAVAKARDVAIAAGKPH